MEGGPNPFSRCFPQACRSPQGPCRLAASTASGGDAGSRGIGACPGPAPVRGNAHRERSGCRKAARERQTFHRWMPARARPPDRLRFSPWGRGSGCKRGRTIPRFFRVPGTGYVPGASGVLRGAMHETSGRGAPDAPFLIQKLSTGQPNFGEPGAYAPRCGVSRAPRWPRQTRSDSAPR